LHKTFLPIISSGSIAEYFSNLFLSCAIWYYLIQFIMEAITRIISIRPVTHDVKQYRFEKTQGYSFIPGQATEVSINKPGWKEEKRPFTFTCLPTKPYLEFTIKSYRDHKGVTNELDQLKLGDDLIIRDVWGAIQYKGEGYIIAGGAGITPLLQY
jgi:ferredoxin-NADP reductase